MKILVGITGSVASIKIKEIVSGFKANGHQVEIVATCNSLRFLSHLNPELSQTVKIWTDEDEWKMWSGRGDSVLHIDLREWADIFVISPLDANTLGKIANGICDNLLVYLIIYLFPSINNIQTCVVRAWNEEKLIFACPAMNTAMWEKQITKIQIEDISKRDGFIIIPPISKTLICGDTGIGAMQEPNVIIDTVLSHRNTFNNKIIIN